MKREVEYIVIAATGGGKLGGNMGDAYVAFALSGNLRRQQEKAEAKNAPSRYVQRSPLQIVQCYAAEETKAADRFKSDEILLPVEIYCRPQRRLQEIQRTAASLFAIFRLLLVLSC
jgi:hypothetical protein